MQWSYKRKPVWTRRSSVVVQSLSPIRLCGPTSPSFPVLQYLPEFAQTHVHCIGDAIQPSHPLSSPSPAFNLSQHQSLFKWVHSSHQLASLGASASASALLMNIQGWFPLRLTDLISSQSKGFSTVFYNTTVQKHQFFGTKTSLWANSHICT